MPMQPFCLPLVPAALRLLDLGFEASVKLAGLKPLVVTGNYGVFQAKVDRNSLPRRRRVVSSNLDRQAQPPWSPRSCASAAWFV
jgi:hypothetical protein